MYNVICVFTCKHYRQKYNYKNISSISLYVCARHALDSKNNVHRPTERHQLIKVGLYRIRLLIILGRRHRCSYVEPGGCHDRRGSLLATAASHWASADCR